jgi:diguanylate cyclase (GGDEF)-like protein
VRAHIDLDGPPVNDSFGHGAGDAILAEVGDRLRSIVSPADLVVRLGGDEFCIRATPPGWTRS